jgi:hypothetical protein
MEQPIQQHNSRNSNNNSSNSRLMVVCQTECERIRFVGKLKKRSEVCGLAILGTLTMKDKK